MYGKRLRRVLTREETEIHEEAYQKGYDAGSFDRTKVNVIANLIVMAILIAFCLLTKRCQAQDEPHIGFLPAGSLELSVPFGFLAQVGIRGQISPVSVMAGVRSLPVKVTSKTGDSTVNQLMARLELAYRIVDGLDVAVGVAKRPDISFTYTERLGNAIAFRGRAGFDRKIYLSAGIVIIPTPNYCNR